MAEDFEDFDVVTSNPQALDQTVQQLGAAVVIEGSYDGYQCTVRAFGNANYIKFAIDQQGYGKVVLRGQ